MCYSEALKLADAKKQKVILRIIKRLVGIIHFYGMMAIM